MGTIVDMGSPAETQLAKWQPMPPPAPRAPKQEIKVLDEDEWTEKIEAIIQRDYFPDVPKLENKLEWLQVIKFLFMLLNGFPVDRCAYRKTLHRGVHTAGLIFLCANRPLTAGCQEPGPDTNSAGPIKYSAPPCRLQNTYWSYSWNISDSWGNCVSDTRLHRDTHGYTRSWDSNAVRQEYYVFCRVSRILRLHCI